MYISAGKPFHIKNIRIYSCRLSFIIEGTIPSLAYLVGKKLTGNISSAVEYHLLNLLPQPSMHIISAGDKVSEFSMESTE
jgi:hypothetical protein